MNKILTLIFVLSFTLFGQSYKQVKIYLNDSEDIRTLASFNLNLDHFQRTKDNAVITFLNDAEFNRLTLLNFRYDVLIDDWRAYYKKLPKMNSLEKQLAIEKSTNQFGVKNFGYGSMGGYYTYDEVIQKLDEMKSLYPNLITTKTEIGRTVEDRPVYSVKISDNPDVDEDEPEVLYTALTHAREPEGMMQMLYFMYYLLENYGTDAEAKYLVNNRELYFIPIINPDGYVYNQTTDPNGGGMWRKNRRNNGGSYGIDLNRNFGPQKYWNAPNSGSSPNPADETYRGIAPFSEPETQSIGNFLASRKIKNALNYHTYGNLLIYPYGALEKETPDSLIFREYAGDMTKSNHYTTGTDQSTVGYSTRGNSDDFMYDGDTATVGKIFAMTPEVGNGSDGFWPAQQRIFPIAEENLFPNLYYAWVAGGYVSLSNYSFDREFFAPGDTVHLAIALKNKGLSDAANVSFSLITDPSKVTAFNATATLANLKSRESYTNDSGFVFVLSPTLKNGETVQIVLATALADVPMASDTLTLTVGTANIVFKDTSLTPLTKWNITSNVAQKWDATTSTYISAPNSFTDSPNGVYANNSTVVMTFKDSINLSNISNPKLSFWTKFDIENDWDCGVVEVSSDKGKTWIAVGGKYANYAAGQGRQTTLNSPVYDGTRQNWVKEEIDLKQFAGKQIKIRFSLLSDEYLQKDGWYLDDISIITFDDITSLSEKGNLQPDEFKLSQNYPNPFNPGTVINYQLAANSFVTLKIYDVLGNEIATLVNEQQSAGRHTAQFEVKNKQVSSGVSAKGGYASGVYFYQLRAGNFVETKKMILLR
ncbi:MAG: immune inhibitor A [Ignavibacteriaceae bacterium]|nr:immune inhibitor A [Ignavibacteriaceae bacterium]